MFVEIITLSITVGFQVCLKYVHHRTNRYLKKLEKTIHDHQ